MIRKHESESLTNQILKDETWKKKYNYTKRSLKIEGEKQLLRVKIKIFNWKVKLNWKLTLTKKYSKEWGLNWKKKTLIEGWNWKLKFF